MSRIPGFVIGGIFLASALAFLIPGIRAFIELPERAQLLKDLRERGIETIAKITFVDRNYSIRVNNQYIYSIVEYEYQNHYGNSQSHRMPRIPGEIPIRHKIEVGSQINIIYHPDKPEKSGWLELENLSEATFH